MSETAFKSNKGPFDVLQSERILSLFLPFVESLGPHVTTSSSSSLTFSLVSCWWLLSRSTFHAGRCICRGSTNASAICRLQYGLF